MTYHYQIKGDKVKMTLGGAATTGGQVCRIKEWPARTWFQLRRAYLLQGLAESLDHPADRG